jgi:hypothetical protein
VGYFSNSPKDLWNSCLSLLRRPDDMIKNRIMPDLRYPIGPFEAGPPLDISKRLVLLSQLAEVPSRLQAAVAGLSESQLDTPYRPAGWTVRQVVHHLADAQMNWYVRTKLALTEDEPLVRPYDEVRWAELHDARTGPLEPSLMMLDGLHRRWVELFRSRSRSFRPERHAADARMARASPHCPHRGVTKPHGLEIAWNLAAPRTRQSCQG